MSTIQISEPTWNRNKWSKGNDNLVKACHGIPSSDERGGPAMIDAGIADLVAQMNETGLATSFCCSALDEDHRNPERMISGYILFDKPLPLALRKKLIGYMESPDCIRLQRHSHTNEQMKAAWTCVHREFQSWNASR